MRVAIVGRSRTANTTVARLFQRPHGFKYLSLDDGVKRTMEHIYGMGKYQKIRWERRTEIYNALYKIDPDIWVGFLAQRLTRTTGDVVCPDARYINELDRLKALGFTIVRVTSNVSVASLTHTYGTSATGSLALNDWFDSNFSDKFGVDYSIHFDKKQIKPRVEQLVQTLRKT